jgi:hypothetical protein
MGLATGGEIRVLDGLLDTVYVSLHTGDPGNTGANEVTGGAYGRVGPISFSGSGNNPTTYDNDDALNFPQATADWGECTHFGLWSASTAGTYLGGDALTASKTIGDGDAARFSAGQLAVTAN